MILITLRLFNGVTDCKRSVVGGDYEGKIKIIGCANWATLNQAVKGVDGNPNYILRLFRNEPNPINAMISARKYCRNPANPTNMTGKSGSPYCFMTIRNQGSKKTYSATPCNIPLCGKHISHPSLLFFSFTN